MSSFCLNATPSVFSNTANLSSNRETKSRNWQHCLSDCQSMLFIREVNDMAALTRDVRAALPGDGVYWQLAADDCQTVSEWSQRLQQLAAQLGVRGDTQEQLIAHLQQSQQSITLLVTHAERCSRTCRVPCGR